MITFKIISDKEEAQAIWELLSPHKILDDEWDFRYAFIKHIPHSLYFIVGYDKTTPIGLIALQLNTHQGVPNFHDISDKDFYEFFGGPDMTDNQIFLAKGYEDQKELFLEQVPRPCVLTSLQSPLIYKGEISEEYTKRYFKNLADYTDHDTFIATTWEGDSRRSMTAGIRKLYANHTVEIKENQTDDLDLLFKLNRERFGEKSTFQYRYREEVFRDLAKSFPSTLLTVVVDGQKEAVSFAVLYKGVYRSLNSGASDKINNLGKLFNFLKIDQAKKLGCTIFDAGKGDGGWKESFKLQTDPQYKLLLV